VVEIKATDKEWAVHCKMLLEYHLKKRIKFEVLDRKIAMQDRMLGE
jgi:hypothetical protein